ncbi:MAG: RecQ family zinc-binding domain-containing protein, partial [Treponema sp.]|nr:RecQ family zinc-binding domain-containing protein [Treponema sp.]
KLSQYLRSAFSKNPQQYCDPQRPEIRFYHAGLSREEKTAVEGWFFSSPRGVLVSTCAYGMGVDKSDIRTVIHRDCPPSVEAYLQESGRAGRDGKPSQAFLLWGPADESQLRRTKDERGRKRIQDLLDYARNTATCRRETLLTLLNYQGEGDKPPENCCDVCEGKSLTAEKLREEGSVLDFFKLNKRAYTPGEATVILSEAEHIGWSAGEAKLVVEELVKTGKLRVMGRGLWRGKITIS